MLELLFKGLVEWLYELILEAWEYFSSALLDVMGMDFAYLESHIAVIPTIRQTLLAVGWALLIGNLVFHAAKSMLSGLGFEGEDPKLLFTRTFVFSFLLLASPQICNICLDMTSKVIELLEVPKAVHITIADNATFSGLACAWLLTVICGIIVMLQSFKLIMEMAERYFILAVLTISAPLAFGMGGSRNTSEIFSGWCRMYGSMCVLMAMNVAFVKMLLSVLSFAPSGIDVLPWMVLVITIVKVAKKADAIITRIGLNPAITGEPLGRSFPGILTYIVARTAVSQVTKAISKGKEGAGSGNRRRTPNVPPGGAGRSGSTGGGKTAYTAVAGSRGFGNSTHTRTATRQDTAGQTDTAQFGERQSAAQEQGVLSSGGQVGQRGVFAGEKGQTRKTSVPPGTRRAATYVKSMAHSAVKAGANDARPSARSAAAQPGSWHASADDAKERNAAEKAAASSMGRNVTPPLSGMAGIGTSASGSPHRTEAAEGSKRQGAANQPTRFVEQTNAAVNGKNAAVGTPGEGTVSSIGQRERNGTAVSGTRATHRPPGEAGVKRPSYVSTAAPAAMDQREPQHTGKAGNTPAGPTRQSFRERLQSRNTSVITGTVQKTGDAVHSGTAGTALAARSTGQSHDAPRQGRNASAKASAVQPSGTMKTAGQERAPESAVAAQVPKGAASAVRPGMAGTAQHKGAAVQTRQSAREAPQRVKQVPVMAAHAGQKSVVAAASDAQKGKGGKSAKRKATSKRKSKGKKHGR